MVAKTDLKSNLYIFSSCILVSSSILNKCFYFVVGSKNFTLKWILTLLNSSLYSSSALLFVKWLTVKLLFFPWSVSTTWVKVATIIGERKLILDNTCGHENFPRTLLSALKWVLFFSQTWDLSQHPFNGLMKYLFTHQI